MLGVIVAHLAVGESRLVPATTLPLLGAEPIVLVPHLKNATLNHVVRPIWAMLVHQPPMPADRLVLELFNVMAVVRE